MYRNKLRATSFEEFSIILREHELKTSSKFVCESSDKAFREEKFTPTSKQKLFWNEDVPYFYIGSRKYACHQGKDTNLYNKKKYAEKRDSKASDGHFIERRNLANPTKKMGCPAGIRVVRVLSLPRFMADYKKWQKSLKKEAIKKKILKGEDIGGENVYYFELPDEGSHQNHTLTTVQKIDPNINCSQCEKVFATSTQLREHERGLHKIYKRKSAGHINIKFNTTQEFHEWLHAEEQKMNFHFVKSRKSHHVTFYKCNKSSKDVSKSTVQHKLKTNGSLKIGTNCTARLVVKSIHIDNSVNVKYFNEHDHELSLHHSPLPTSPKKVIVEKTTTQECYDQILKDVRENVKVPENRCHLATRQDLDDSETPLQQNSYSGGSNSSFSSDIDQNVNSVERRTTQKRKRKKLYPEKNVNAEEIVNAEENYGDRAKLLCKLMTVYNKVKLVPEIPQPTIECVMGVLQNIETLLDMV